MKDFGTSGGFSANTGSTQVKDMDSHKKNLQIIESKLGTGSCQHFTSIRHFHSSLIFVVVIFGIDR
jgi:hypothetical protein